MNPSTLVASALAATLTVAAIAAPALAQHPAPRTTPHLNAVATTPTRRTPPPPPPAVAASAHEDLLRRAPILGAQSGAPAHALCLGCPGGAAWGPALFSPTQWNDPKTGSEVEFRDAWVSARSAYLMEARDGTGVGGYAMITLHKLTARAVYNVDCSLHATGAGDIEVGLMTPGPTVRDTYDYQTVKPSYDHVMVRIQARGDYGVLFVKTVGNTQADLYSCTVSVGS